MGIYADIFYEKDVRISDDKKEELSNRMEVLFQSGGMMQFDTITLYNTRINMIRPARINKYGLNVCYNYFEDDIWGSAGFNKDEGYVWSDKVGYGAFARTIVAAYVLQELYTDGVAITTYNGEPVTSWGYVGWINYLFKESYHIKNFDQWNLFEFACGEEYLDEEQIEWMDFGITRYAFVAGCEIYAVLNDVEQALEKYKDVEQGVFEKDIYKNMKYLVNALEQYKADSDLDKEGQIDTLLSKICRLYQLDFEENIEKYFNMNEDGWLEYLEWCDAPALCVKKIAELYECDFWSLWKRIRLSVKRRATKLYGNDGYNVLPISTEKFFRLTEDDMIPFWKSGDDFQFSKELCDWFEMIKCEIQKISESDFEKGYSLRAIMSLMKRIEEGYRVFVFAEFLEETIENLKDERYIKLWFMYENLLHKLENEMKDDYKERKKILRRYMALIGNKELRKEVLGIE